MKQWSEDLDERCSKIASVLSPIVSKEIKGHSIAEIMLSTDEWDRWDDLPIRLKFTDGVIVSISWSEFDLLSIWQGDDLPEWHDSETRMRWVDSLDECVSRVHGAIVMSVYLGADKMSMGENEFEIWVRLLIETSVGFLEISNGLDENDFAYHKSFPDGKFVKCA